MTYDKSRQLAYRIRRHALDMTNRGGTAHIGSIFSMADIVAVLYADVMRYDPANPKWPGRDRLVLSKGHAGAGIYAALAECGFFPLSELETHCQNGSRLSGHVSHKGVPGVEVSTGSLGQGMPMAMGMAMAGKMNGEPHSVFCIIGDGECDEGAIWESALIANQFGLDNLIVTVDFNKIQSIASVEKTIRLEPLDQKWASFGWHVIRIDGHDHAALHRAYADAQAARGQGKPIVVIADTVKGKGVSFMENDVLWHYRTARGEEYDRAVKELEAQKP
ncbi:MAG TPA: transketolase [Candidatus Limiplasma sp.]|nr:transketolase [Candidatus Limiplasma sp.]HPS81880.1 transketolase [Candidatus Limiplasma sp.]